MQRSLTIQGRIKDNSTRRDLPASVHYGRFTAPAGDLPLYREHEGQVIGAVQFWRGLDCLRFIGKLNYNIPDGPQLERDVRDGNLYQTSVSGEALEETVSHRGLGFPKFQVTSLSLVSVGAIADRSVIEATYMESTKQRASRHRLLSRADTAANESRELEELRAIGRERRRLHGIMYGKQDREIRIN